MANLGLRVSQEETGGCLGEYSLANSLTEHFTSIILLSFHNNPRKAFLLSPFNPSELRLREV